MSGRPRSIGVRIGIVLAISVMGAIWSGCGEGDFVPPPPGPRGDVGSADLGSSTVAPKGTAAPFASGGTVRRIDYIESSRIDPDEAQIEQAAVRTQAGFDKARLHLSPTDDDAGSPGSSAARARSQADRIRASIAGKPQAIIVDPDDPADPELGRAVREARAAKVPVVVIGHPIAGAGEPKAPDLAPMILVAPQPFSNTAPRLVELSIRNLKTAKLDPAQGALMVIPTTGDRLIPDRVAAIRKALADAKITRIDELRIPREIGEGAKLLKERLQKDPKPVMLFFVEYYGASVGREVSTELGEKHPYVQAGYTPDEGRTRMVRAGDYAGVAEYEPNRLVRKAVTVAALVAQGKEPKEKEEVTINLLESPAGSGLPTFYGRQLMERTKGEG